MPYSTPVPADFGAIGDGTADDTGALQLFLDYLVYSGTPGLLSPGTYRTTTSLSVNGPLHLRGSGARSPIRADAGTFSVLQIGNGVGRVDRGVLEDVTIESAGLRNGGATIDLDYAFLWHFYRCEVLNCNVGFRLNRAYQTHVVGCSVRGLTPLVGTGILIDGQGNDQYIRDTMVVGAPPGWEHAQPLAGVRIVQTGACWLNNVGSLKARTGFLVKPTTGKVVEFVFSSQCAADTGDHIGYDLDGRFGVVRSWNSTDDWASSNVMNGVLIRGCSDVKLSGMRCYNNGQHGIQAASANDLCLSECECSGNGGFSTPSFHGIALDLVHGCRVVACRSGQVSSFANLQGYGLYMSNPASTNVIVDGCDFRGNLTGPCSYAGSPKIGTNWP